MTFVLPYNDPRREASIVIAMLHIALGGSGSTCARINGTQQIVSAELGPALELYRGEGHQEMGIKFIDSRRVEANDMGQL